MLALSSSHRGVRLHTFEPEDRAYTSTPTKIGGHALDHVVGVTLAWSRTLNKRKKKSDSGGGAGCLSDRAFVAEEGGARGAACCTTLEPSIGRFGGVSAAVHSPRRCRPDEAPPSAAVFVPPLCPALAVLPPDTLAAPRNIAAGVDGSWQEHQHRHQEWYNPEWAVNNCNLGELEAVAPPLLGGTNSSSTSTAVAARTAARGRVVPYRNVATAATGHSGALMAILLSKLANSGHGSTDSPTFDTAANSCATSDAPPAAPPAAILLHRSVDSIAQGLDSAVDVGPAASVVTRGGGSWAWKARVDQTPHYSKLRRYDFVRELGSGSHGTILLVRKRPAANHHTHSSVGDGVLNAKKNGGARGGGGTTRFGSDGSSRSSVENSGKDTGRSTPGGGGLRVLKESPFLPEAVNEARLLLLAGGGGGGGGDGGDVEFGLASRARTVGAGMIGTGAGEVGVGGVVTTSRGGGGGGRGYQRGEVVQVRTRTAVFLFGPRSRSLVFFLHLTFVQYGKVAMCIDLSRLQRPPQPMPNHLLGEATLRD